MHILPEGSCMGLCASTTASMNCHWELHSVNRQTASKDFSFLSFNPRVYVCVQKEEQPSRRQRMFCFKLGLKITFHT